MGFKYQVLACSRIVIDQMYTPWKKLINKLDFFIAVSLIKFQEIHSIHVSVFLLGIANTAIGLAVWYIVTRWV